MADLGDLYRTVGLDTNVQAPTVDPAYFKTKQATTPVPGFATNLAKSALSLPTQAAGAVGHAIVDPFVNLVQNNVNALQQGKNASNIDQQRTTLDKASQQLEQGFKQGHISRQDYIAGLRSQKQAYLSLSGSAKQNVESVKSTAQMLPDAASAIGTVATLGAGGLAKGAAEAALKSAPGIVGKAGGIIGKAADALIGSGKTVGKNVVTQVAGKAARTALVTQPTVQAPLQAIDDAKNGNYG